MVSKFTTDYIGLPPIFLSDKIAVKQAFWSKRINQVCPYTEQPAGEIEIRRRAV